MATDYTYINAPSNAAINNTATAGWFQLMRGGSTAVGFQVVIAATGAPTGTIVFEICNDDDPRVQGPLGATTLTLPASMAAGQPAGSAISFLFDFNPAPSAKWMRLRYAPSGGGSANAGTFLVGVNQRGL